MKITSLRLGGVLRLLACAGVLMVGLAAAPAMAKDAIVLCTIDDLSGDFSIMSTPKTYGQQQWLSIAMSMALEPEVLLLDEPTAGMSSEETRKTAAIIRDLNRSGATVIVIEHDMGFVRDLQARTSVLHYGRLFAQGSFDEIAADADVRRIYLGTL